MLQHRNSCPEHVQHLRCARYLPVEVSAAKLHFQSKHACPLMGIHCHDKPIHATSGPCSVEPEVSSSPLKLLWVADRTGQLTHAFTLHPLLVRPVHTRHP